MYEANAPADAGGSGREPSIGDRPPPTEGASTPDEVASAPVDGAGPTPSPPSSATRALPSADERQWGMLSHALTLLGYVVPFGHLVPPLVILITKRDESEFVADQARESLQFQVTVLIAILVSLPLVCLLVGIPMLVLIGLAHFVLTIVAAVAASDGKRYSYPFSLRFLR
jgi:uncharacterized Tic20 family protein